MARRFRYRLMYPVAGRILFPAPRFEEDAFVGIEPNVRRWEINFRPEDFSHLVGEAELLCQRKVKFLNLPVRYLGDPIDWKIESEDPLWQYCLHCGEWAMVLAEAFKITRDYRYKNAMIEWIRDWIDNNPAGSVPGWDPYPISKRIVAWIKAAVALYGEEDWARFWHTRLAPSLSQQANFLLSNLERDLENNHLVSNYRALAWMGILFPKMAGAERWRKEGLEGLWNEVRRQVLPDGVHEERSISYHTMVLQDLLETWWILKCIGEKTPDDVEDSLVKMLYFLSETQTADSTWPMVNDTVPGYPADFAAVLFTGATLFNRPEWLSRTYPSEASYATWPIERFGEMFEGNFNQPSVKAFAKAGYVVLKGTDRSYLFFDAGPMGPGHMPGHGHADALSFVLYRGETPLIVDPGVYSYHDQNWRDRFRCTAAHNTVTVDREDQCIYWGPFRVAFAPTVRLLDWSEDHVTGEHEGYLRLANPVLHRRQIRRRAPDEIEIHDRFEGRGRHHFAMTLQLAAGATIERGGPAAISARWQDKINLEVIPNCVPDGAEVTVEKGWISPGWYIKEEAPRYVLQWESIVPVETRIVLRIRLH